MDNNKYLNIKESLGKSLATWTLESKTEFLDAKNINQELLNVAKEKGITDFEQDLAMFKTIYAEIGIENLNNVTITKEGAEAGIHTAAGKQINWNHLGRHQVCGFLLGGKIEGQKIILYGAIFKSVFREDFEIVKELFDEGKLFVSYELHTMDAEGNFVAEIDEKNHIRVNKMLISGCGLLIRMDGEDVPPPPACPRARVLKLLANVEKTAKMLNAVDLESDIIYAEQFLPKENSKKEENKVEEIIIDADYEGGEIEEAKKLTTEQRNALPDGDFALIQEKDGKKVRRFPINDEAHVRNALARLPQAKDISEEERKLTLRKILKRAKELKMTDLLEKYKAEIDAMVASGEINAEVPIAKPEEKPVKVISRYVQEYMMEVGEDGGEDYSSKSYEKIIRTYADGREEIEIKEGSSNNDSKITKYVSAQLKVEEQIATTKAVVEATIPAKVKEAEDKIRAEKDAEITSIKANAEKTAKEVKTQTDESIANKDTEIASLKVENEKNKAELATKKFTVEDVEKAKADAQKIVARRIALGDVNKEISEADLLDDKEFEIRRLTKENEALKASKKDSPDFIVGGEGNKKKNEIGGTLKALVDGYCQG